MQLRMYTCVVSFDLRHGFESWLSGIQVQRFDRMRLMERITRIAPAPWSLLYRNQSHCFGSREESGSHQARSANSAPSAASGRTFEPGCQSCLSSPTTPLAERTDHLRQPHRGVAPIRIDRLTSSHAVAVA